jgi:hypothetical protein
MVIFSSKDMLTYRKFCHVIYLQGWCEISKIADEVKLAKLWMSQEGTCTKCMELSW